MQGFKYCDPEEENMIACFFKSPILIEKLAEQKEDLLLKFKKKNEYGVNDGAKSN